MSFTHPWTPDSPWSAETTDEPNLTCDLPYNDDQPLRSALERSGLLALAGTNAPSDPDALLRHLEDILRAHAIRHLIERRRASVRAWLERSLCSIQETDGVPALLMLDDGRHAVPWTRIGRGGFGDAWVTDAEGMTGTVVAKFARERPHDGCGTREANRRLTTEGHLLAALDDVDGVPRLLGSGAVAGRPFLLLEHIDGRTWKDVVAERKTLRLCPSWLQAWIDVSTVLAALHQRGIVHGDVKPENVMIGSRSGCDNAPRAWLIDYGLSLRERYAGTPCASGTAGTAGYLDPRSIGSEFDKDRSSDVYALGAMIFEAYTNLRLLSPDEWRTVRTRHRDALDAPSYARWFDALMGSKQQAYAAVTHRCTALEHLVTRMLTYEAQKRPSATETAKILAGILRNYS